MLVIRPLPAGGHRYLTAAVGPAGGPGEKPGLWLGRGAASLDLAGEVDAPVLDRVLDGRSPDGTRALCAVRAGRRCGLELVFAAPKSMSVTALLTDCERRDELVGAHRGAVADAIEYLEDHACSIRDRNRLVDGDGVIAAAFVHRVSRANDPHLHSHVLLANLSRRTQQRWYALYTPEVFREAPAAAAVYAASLRARTSELGLSWSPTDGRRYEVHGVPRRVIDAFSRRRAEVVARRGRDDDVVPSLSAAVRLTRPSRPALVDVDSLATSWNERAAGLGFDPAEPAASRNRGHAVTCTPAVNALDRITMSTDVFRRRDLVRECADGHHAGAFPHRIQADVDAVLASDGVLRLERGRFTTRNVQRDAFKVLTRFEERDAVTAVDLAAGARRTDLVQAIGRLANADGTDVQLVAPSRSTARSLEALTAVVSGAVDDAREPQPMLIVIDAERLCTAQLSGLVDRRGSTVLIGTSGRSATFDLLLDTGRGPVVAEPDARSEGPRTVIETRRGPVTVHETVAQARTAAVAAWQTARASGRDTLLVAPAGELDDFSLPPGAIVAPADARRMGPCERVVLGAGPVAPSATTNRHVVGPMGYSFVAPPRWLRVALGAPPSDLADRARWYGAAQVLAGYRARWNIELDEPPRTGIEQRLDRRRTMEQIAETRRDLGLPPLSIERDRGISR